MPQLYSTLTLDDAKRMLQSGEAAAAKIGLPYNIAVVDAGGNLIAFVRSARQHRSRHRQGENSSAFRQDNFGAGASGPTQCPLFGIEQTNEGKVVIFGGGLPVRIDGHIFGAVGSSPLREAPDRPNKHQRRKGEARFEIPSG